MKWLGSKEKMLTLGNGLKVKLVVGENCVEFHYQDEFVSYNPSMKVTGVSTVDTSHTMLNLNGELCDKNGNSLYLSNQPCK
jgi:hypothetical protein